MVLENFFTFPVLSVVMVSLALGFFLRISLIPCLKKLASFLEKKWFVHQIYRVPKFNGNMQENMLFRKVYTYLNSLPCVGESDFANLYSSSRSSEINLVLHENQIIVDKFIGSRIEWRIDSGGESEVKSLVMKIRKNSRRRILVPYMQHIHQFYDEMEKKRNTVRLFVNVENETEVNGRWRWTPFTHPATMETIVMDPDLKTRIKYDLENFLKSRQYYHGLGRVWKRSYLLYGSAGTGKSTFIAAMAKFLSYDIYEIDLHKLSSDSDLKYLLLQTTNKSLIVIEDLDRFLSNKSPSVTLTGILNFMDGLFSGCCDERVMVFTMNSKENTDTNLLRPGRIDVHIHFPLCDFSAFKSIVSSHLGLKDHKLFPQVEEIFQTGATLSQAEISEILISNRTSPSRALKTVISALEIDSAYRFGKRMNRIGTGQTVEDCIQFGSLVKEGQNGIHPIKEIKNLYGILRARSRKASVDKLDFDLNEKDKENAFPVQET